MDFHELKHKAKSKTVISINTQNLVLMMDGSSMQEICNPST